MFKYYFEQVHNVEVWPIISLIIFFVFFIGLIVYVWRMRKDYIEYMEEIPLADDNSSEFQSQE